MIAVDTNILVYSVDAEQPAKRDLAAQLLKSLESEQTIILWQVLMEAGAVLSRKKYKSDILIPIPLLLSAWLDQFKLVMPTKVVASEAWRLIDAHQLSYWDAILLAACLDAGVTRLYTEDVQSRPVIEGVEIVNPFKP